MCFDILYELFLKYFSLKEEFGEILWYIYVGFNMNYTLLLSDCLQTWIFSTDFQKILKYVILWHDVQWDSIHFMRAVGRTGGGRIGRYDEANSNFSQFCVHV
jgi:hypothetical protein